MIMLNVLEILDDLTARTGKVGRDEAEYNALLNEAKAIWKNNVKASVREYFSKYLKNTASCKIVSGDRESTPVEYALPINQACMTGINVVWELNEKQSILNLNFDHIVKPEIDRLFAKGWMKEEILLLYHLAHLPFAISYARKISTMGFLAIDRVLINMNASFNPLDEEKLDAFLDNKLANKSHSIPFLEFDSRIEKGIEYLMKLEKKPA